MITFDATLTAALAAETLRPFWLLELGFTTPAYYTDCDIPLTYATNQYSPRAMQVSPLRQSSGLGPDRVDIDLDNVDLTLSAVILNEDIVFKTASLYIGCVDDNYQLITPAALFTGFVENWNLSEDRARLRLADEFLLWNRRTLRKYQATCPWIFKGAECGYTGAETWCDQQYGRCTQLANTDNFGGFRWLPAISEKNIWWGREPKE